MRLITTDNSIKTISNPQALEDLGFVADCPLKRLVDKDKNNVWLFPQEGERNDDMIEDEELLSIEGNNLKTGNIMGFLGYGSTELTIRSRFSNKDGNDWFMQYMLQKVFAINIFSLKHSLSNENALDITPLLFPYFLQKAISQGLYREYIRKEYNDSRVRGALDFSRHIKSNYPFKNGKISYSTREYTYDNSVTQLIRHTIEYLKSKRTTYDVLVSSSETRDYIKRIVEATPTYRKSDLQKVMLANLKPKIHPYYSEYRPLQKLCLQILKGEKTSYGESSNKIHGVLFDGAWLWEEYLNLTFSKAGFKHPRNKTGEGAIFPFADRKRYKRYPDFMANNVIADAKYKRLMTLDNGRINDNIQRDDLSQMIAYLHITASQKGIFVSPSEFSVINLDDGTFYPSTRFVLCQEELSVYKVGDLLGNGGEILILSVNIPKGHNSYAEFVSAMNRTEAILLNKIKEVTV